MGRGQDGESSTSTCPGILFSILWFFGIFVLAWPIAGLVSGIYLLLSPLAACIGALKGALKVMLGLLNFPYMFARNMVTMAPCSGSSWRLDSEV